MKSAVIVALAAGVVFFTSAPPSMAQMTLQEAIKTAVTTNPRIGEAAANRRAVDQEVQQAQGALLPQIRAQGEWGNERLRRFDTPVAAGANEWRRAGGEVSVVATQMLFDGFSSINQIYRQMARSEAASWRTMERAELIALDTAEAYLDILRYSASLRLAAENLATHQRLAQNVDRRFDAGRSGRGDANQVRERLAGAMAVQAELRTRLEDAKAAFRRSVGKEPNRLAGAARPHGVPKSRQDALNLTISSNPTILAARADATAAEREYDASAGIYAPRVFLEGRMASGRDNNDRAGAYDTASAKIKMDFPIFTGGTLTARRSELSERRTEAILRTDSLRRSAFESVDRAWAARSITGSRIDALNRQVVSARAVVEAYRGEYELGQRTLLDLLNAQNALFNAQLALESARVVSVFADYQLLATTGSLLTSLNIPRPLESDANTWRDKPLLPALQNVLQPLR